MPRRGNYGSLLNILVVLTPIGWVAHFAKWDAYIIFIVNLIALIPLATIISKITEDLALRFGDTIGESSMCAISWGWIESVWSWACRSMHLDRLLCA